MKVVLNTDETHTLVLSNVIIETRESPPDFPLRENPGGE